MVKYWKIIVVMAWLQSFKKKIYSTQKLIKALLYYLLQFPSTKEQEELEEPLMLH